MRILAVRADITRLEVDAVVNAANSALAGGGGVDGAIHRAAGLAQLQAACAGLGGCEPGDAKATPGFSLPARWIIHTVGPIWQGGGFGEADVLASCYRRCLSVAGDLGATSVAFPAISTGVYGYPRGQAASVAVSTLRDAAGSGPAAPGGAGVAEAYLVAFDDATLEIYNDLLG
jgi:O-acetyl-ADP-ribose deacetylase (regulator of RNase III)